MTLDRPHSRQAAVAVLDIEGTTSAAGFVLGDLYDYARPRLGPWIDAHGSDPDVAGAVASVRSEASLPDDASTADVVKVLHGWMDADVKATPLKTLQGQIWAEGFAKDELTSHFFDDVVPALRDWVSAGVRLAVFSSGSVASQRPWFAKSPSGDLGPMVDGYFDTVNAGPKKVADSFHTIADALGQPGDRLLFLSDLPAELDAARDAGWATVGVVRPGEPNADADFGDHLTIASFAELEVTAS